MRVSGASGPAIGLFVVVAAASVLWVATAHGSVRATSELQVNALLEGRYQFGDFCQPDIPVDNCVRFRAVGLVPGLGRATVTYEKNVSGDADCPVVQFRTAVVAVEGKGTIGLTVAQPPCGPTAPASVGPIEVQVSGGTGLYAGATGSLRFQSRVFRPVFSCGPCGNARDAWVGTIAVPNASFDVTPPVLSGATAKLVRAPAGAERARVRYVVTAHDAVDGLVRVACTPPSGRSFRLGRTIVTCSATDASGNTGRARFPITVRR